MTLSLYAQYVAERLGRGIVETEDGFATFDYISDDTVYIVDLYVTPEKRKSRVASTIADKICEEAVKSGRKYLLGSVDTTTKGAESSVKVLQAYGMHFHKEAKPMLFFAKQIAPDPINDAIRQTKEVIEAEKPEADNA